MKAYTMMARSPLEVGDQVLLAGLEDNGVDAFVTEIDVIHHASSNSIEIVHYVNGWVVPLSAIACRIVNGRRVPIGDAFSESIPVD